MTKDHDYMHRVSTMNSYSAIYDDVRRFIDQHLGHNVLLLDEFCTSKGVARRSVQRALSWYNTNWKELLVRRRMHEASRLLRQTDGSVKYIAKKVGYKNASHFSKAFKDYTAISPTEYREDHRVLHA